MSDTTSDDHISDPLPDPRSRVNDESSDEEVDDLFALQLNASRNSSEDNNAVTKTSKGRLKKSAKRQPKTLSCDVCQPKRVFRKTKIRDKHVELLHSAHDNKQVEGVGCLWCGQHFATQYQLSVHQKLYFHDKPS